MMLIITKIICKENIEFKNIYFNKTLEIALSVRLSDFDILWHQPFYKTVYVLRKT